MRQWLASNLAGAAVVILIATAAPLCAAELVVGPGELLQAALDRAADGDTVIVEGEHRGGVRIERKITLEGRGDARIDGEGRGSVVFVAAPGAVVRGLTLRGSGRDLVALDAGVFVEKTATGTIVESNRIEGNLYGICLHGAENAIARGNTIIGISEGRINEAGNGVSIWNAPGARVENNDIRFGRDGIFVVASKRNSFTGNRFRDLRFAVHYMYTDDSEISCNTSIGNTVGFAIMFSHRLTVRGNVSDGDRDHGLLFNFANSSDISNNVVKGRLQSADRWLRSGMRGKDAREHGLPSSELPVADRTAGDRVGPEKCVFIYNANKNRFHGNRFEACQIGVHFTAGSEGNEITGNAFVNNRNQVKYVGSRFLDWSKDGRGNYWSDNPAFDLNGDGIADSPYRPNDVMDKVLWTVPNAKILSTSPAVQIIRWAQSQFPALLPGGVVDSHPLMAAPTQPSGCAGGARS